MAHFAKIDENNIVEIVIVVNNINLLNEQEIEDEKVGIQFLKSIYGQETNWVQTSYNRNFRNLFASQGYKYIQEEDIFIMNQPYSSWTYNDVSKNWDPPVPFPNDGNGYMWDEENIKWVML